MLRKTTIIPILAALMTLGATLGFAARQRAPQEDTRHAKARYYYVEGSVAMAEGRMSEAYELLRKAVQTDPDYPEAAYSYALVRMSLSNDTLQSPAEVRRSIEMMRPFVDAYPEETGEAMNYSFLAARAGDMDEAIRVAERTDTLAPDLTGTLLQLAQYYSIRRDFDKAIRMLERYERIEGSDPELALRRFSLMLSKGDTVGLLSESRRLVAENPVNSDYMLIRGNVFEAIEMPDSALRCYLQAESMDPDDGRPKLTLANYYLERGDSAAYDVKSREALLSENIMLDEKLQMMTRYMQNIIADSADTARGTRLFDGLLGQYPHEPRLLDLGAQYFAATDNLERAEELMAYATDLDPDNPDYWLRLASFYFSDQKYALSQDAAERGIARLKETPRTLLYILGAAAVMNGEYAKAREVYQRQLDMDMPGTLLTDSVDAVLKKASSLDFTTLEKIAGIFAMAGDCSSKQDDLQAAVREYEVSVALDPTNMMSANNYAFFLAISGGDLDRAEELSRKTTQENPDNPTYLDTLAWILYLKGQYADALEIQEKVVEMVDGGDENTGEYWDHLGDMLFRTGRKQEALESWKKARALGSDNPALAEKIRTKTIVQ